MATIILNHHVKEYSEWKDHYDKDLNFRTSLGINKILKVDYPRGKPRGILPTLFQQKS